MGMANEIPPLTPPFQGGESNVYNPLIVYAIIARHNGSTPI
jgi:hypothetical protein